MLRIEPGGKIIEEKWCYDETIGKGHYEDVDITTCWFHKRNHHTKISDGVVLNDIFEIVARDPEVCDFIFANCFVKEYVDSWKTKTMKTGPNEYDPDGFEYLELYWAPDYHTDRNGKGTVDGLNLAGFHAIGWELREDKIEEWGKYDKGTRISWGFGGTSFAEYLHLPIKLNKEFKIMECIHKIKPGEYLPTLFEAEREYSLHDIIEGIFYELSFYGTDEERKEKFDEIEKSIDEIKGKDYDQLISEGKLIPISESLNDGYINDGWQKD